ncbi:hypothetical protein FH972_027287 [Carpinus fangiana]|uniref:Uncharacterized protein n=1 Tax=Carpinus fangiana TaxID=176857 RepID=A0A5N6LGI4_9ROSI|nr:hypothetical protein FH972_027287 [Carpinus fangiana]
MCVSFKETESAYEFSEDAIVVREWLRESDEDHDVRGVRGKSALDEVVENESDAGLDAVLHQHHSPAQRPSLGPVVHQP